MATIALEPPRGALPVLQYLTPAQLSVDPTYQRKLDASSSEKLIREIAQPLGLGAVPASGGRAPIG